MQFSHALLALVLCAVTGLPASAQDRRPPDRDVRVPSPTRVTEPEPALPANAVRIRVRYPQAMGYVTAATLDGSVTSCSAFEVDATIIIGAEGTLGRPEPLGGLRVQETRMRREGREYVCDYTILDLPLDRPITVSARVVDEASYRSGRWHGGASAVPPAGHERVVVEGMRRVTLSRRTPRASVDFRMRYVPLRTGTGR